MKKFSEMSQSEINSLSKEEFMSISPFEKRSCYDCGHLKQALSWWCGNKDAIKKRGTTIPGCIKCPFWAPDWNLIDDKYKTPENGYIEPTKPLEKIEKDIKEKSVKWYNKILKLFQ
jgi:hypothetical protein